MTKTATRMSRWVTAAWVLIFFMGAGFRVLADCSSFGLPFTDLGSETTFCAAIAEAYYTGVTNGTSPTTFSPNANVTRAQVAAFATRTLEASLARGSKRAALQHFWSVGPQTSSGLGITVVGSGPQFPQSDGLDVWVPNNNDGTVTRVRASDGSVLGTWTGATGAWAVLVAMGRIFITGYLDQGCIYVIDPTQPPGPVSILASNLGGGTRSIAFDGEKIWTGNFNEGSLSLVTPIQNNPPNITKVTGFTLPSGLIFDGHRIWVASVATGMIYRLDPEGAIETSVQVGRGPELMTFDGANIWVPNSNDASLSVVRSSDGSVLKTFTGNGLFEPFAAGFDGQRVLVTDPGYGNVSLYRSSTLTEIGFFPTGMPDVAGVCSDGMDFWVTSGIGNQIKRF